MVCRDRHAEQRQGNGGGPNVGPENGSNDMEGAKTEDAFIRPVDLAQDHGAGEILLEVGGEGTELAESEEQRGRHATGAETDGGEHGHAGEGDVEGVTGMVEEMAKWGGGGGAAGLLAVEIVEDHVDEEGEAGEKVGPGGGEGCEGGGIGEEGDVAGEDDEEAQEGDGVGGEPQREEVDEAGVERVEDVLVGEGAILAAVLVFGEGAELCGGEVGTVEEVSGHDDGWEWGVVGLWEGFGNEKRWRRRGKIVADGADVGGRDSCLLVLCDGADHLDIIFRREREGRRVGRVGQAWE